MEGERGNRGGQEGKLGHCLIDSNETCEITTPLCLCRMHSQTTTSCINEILLYEAAYSSAVRRQIAAA